jgi:hypothetical protein
MMFFLMFSRRCCCVLDAGAAVNWSWGFIECSFAVLTQLGVGQITDGAVAVAE